MRIIAALLVLCLVFAGCTNMDKTDKKNISSKVYGHVMADQGVFVPYANISVTCGISGRTRAVADAKGYYLVDVKCPAGSSVDVSVWSGPQDVCVMLDVCMPFKGGAASAYGNISSAGFAKIDPVIK
jgi:hypothetical protein